MLNQNVVENMKNTAGDDISLCNTQKMKGIRSNKNKPAM